MKDLKIRYVFKHEKEGETIEPCLENDSPYVNSLDLEKFVEKLYEKYLSR